MTPLAAVIVLAAALVHALWNVLLSKSDDDHSRTAAAILIGAVALLPLALADSRVEPAAWPFIAVSAVFELASGRHDLHSRLRDEGHGNRPST